MASKQETALAAESATKSSRKRDAASPSPSSLDEGECKRTRLPPQGRTRLPPAGRTIRDVLPDSLLAAVCDFLPVPSRLLTAVALGEGNSGIIGGAPITSLDFEQVERDLAGRLTDDHLELMLRASDAATCLQILKLAGCTNITGSGLRPLRGSRVLRQVDLTLRRNHEAVKKEEGEVVEEARLSKEEVISFLQTLLDGGGTALRDVSFPYAWWRDPAVRQWRESFDQYTAECRVECSKIDCGNLISSRYHETCYDCLNIICEPCLNGDEDNLNGCPIVSCVKCERNRCQECTTRQKNGHSGWDYCSGCMPVTKKCTNCDYVFCGADEEDFEVYECTLVRTVVA